VLNRKRGAPDPSRGSSGRPDFDEFFRAEFVRLTRYVMTLGATKEEAKDAAQNALVDAWEHWESIKSPHAWCRTAANRYYISSDIRINKEAPLAEKSGWAVQGTVKHIQDFFPPDWEYVLRHLRKLAPVRRSVMAYTIDGYSPQEIAEMTGTNPGTVRSNLRYAKKQLVEEINKEQADLAESKKTKRSGQ